MTHKKIELRCVFQYFTLKSRFWQSITDSSHILLNLKEFLRYLHSKSEDIKTYDFVFVTTVEVYELYLKDLQSYP